MTDGTPFNCLPDDRARLLGVVDRLEDALTTAEAAEASALTGADALRAENGRLRAVLKRAGRRLASEIDTRNSLTGILDSLWSLIYTVERDGSWEYPGQVVSHIRLVLAERLSRAESAETEVKRLLEGIDRLRRIATAAAGSAFLDGAMIWGSVASDLDDLLEPKP